MRRLRTNRLSGRWLVTGRKRKSAIATVGPAAAWKFAGPQHRTFGVQANLGQIGFHVFFLLILLVYSFGLACINNAINNTEGKIIVALPKINKNKNYKYLWYEDSGEFSEATCNFIEEKALCLNWHNSLFVQTFQGKENGSIELEMRYPKNKDEYDVVLKVLFKKV